ncbi:MarR family winged helix-turn-helix transcriptional regulator [Trueperella sp. LYQ143]|uniref:MarR family winged helix-turn-helix transcriptional regulator n=1 Tax=unclassified Trueperella TaxID=2630174 RepID=UPI003982DDD0
MVNWLSDEEQLSWRRFLRGYALVLEGVNQDLLNQSDLSINEYEVLVRLSESPDFQLRMSCLARDLVHSRSRLTHAIKRMEDRGLVRRHPCSEDRRGIVCQLTQEGYRTLVRAAPGHVESVRQHLLDHLTSEEFATLGEIFGKLIEKEEK